MQWIALLLPLVVLTIIVVSLFRSLRKTKGFKYALTIAAAFVGLFLAAYDFVLLQYPNVVPKL